MSAIENKLKIQTMLLISHKPVRFKEFIQVLKIEIDEVGRIIESLRNEFNTKDSGWWIVETNDAVQLVTNPSQTQFIEEYLQVEQMAELTKPALETLTIIAYSGPISKMVLDKIRGVNCSLIIRNLMIKGLVEEVSNEGEKKLQVTMDFVKHLGLSDISELPDFGTLNDHEYIKGFNGEAEQVEEKVEEQK